MSVDRLVRTATRWRTAITSASTAALAATVGAALVVVLVVVASRTGVPQAVKLPQWWGAWPTGAAYRAEWSFAVVALVGALCVVWARLARGWLRVGAPVPRLRAILLVAVAWATPFTLAGPIGSLDVQSYAAVGRLAQIGMNPYAFGPQWLHGPYEAFATAVSSEWQYSPSPYGPLQVALLREVAAASGAHVGLSVLLIRAVAVAGLAAAVVLAVEATPVRERASVLLLVALNPLVLVHVVSGAHLDVLVGAMAVAVVLLVRKGMPTVAMVVAVVACMLKLPGLVLVGYVGLDVLRRTDRDALRTRLAQVLGAAATTVVATVALVPDAFGWIGALSVPGQIKSGLTPSTWLAWLIQGAAGIDTHSLGVTTTIARLLTAAVGVAVTARLLWYATEGPERAAYLGVGWGLMVVAFSGPTTYPWYLTWGLFAAAVGSRVRGRLALLALSVTYALLGAWGGGGAHNLGVLVMLAAFAGTGVVVWRTARGLLGAETPVRALATASA
jgi:hypothetical protein